MTEELEQKAEESRLSTKSGHELSYDPKYREVYDKGYIAGATEVTKELQEEKTMETCKEPCKLLKDACLLANKSNELQEQIENLINEIDKTMVLSNMREYEICDIQDIFRKYGFKRNSNDIWEIKEK